MRKAPQKIQRFNPRVLLLLVGLGLPSFVSAEVTVTINYPTLIPQLSRLQPLVNQQLATVAGQIQGTLNSFLNKPLVLGAFADAGSLSVLPVWNSPWNGSPYAFSLSNTASVMLDSFNFATWVSRLTNLTPTSDYQLGVNLSPTTLWLGGTLAPWTTSVYLKAVAGWSPYSYENTSFLSKSLGFFGAWQMVRPVRLSPWWSWLGLEADTGLGWNDNEASTQLALSTVTQSFTVGAQGPYPSLTVKYSVSPSVQVSLLTQTFSVPFQLSTGFEWARIFDVSAGVGNYLSWGNSSIGLSGTQQVQILSQPLSNLIQSGSNPSLTFSGMSTGTGPHLTGTYFWLRLGYRVGLITIEVPVLYRLIGGFETGLEWGAEF